MGRRKHSGVLLRAGIVISGVALIVGGVTFAALQSQNVTLQGNRITSATANLEIGDAAGKFGVSTAGFNFSNVEPGGAPAPATANLISLRNSGTSNLALGLTMDASTYTSQNANLDRVYLNLTPADGGPTEQLALSSLTNAYMTGKPATLSYTLPAGTTTQYKVQIQIAADADTSATSPIDIEGMDLIFNGASVIS